MTDNTTQGLTWARRLSPRTVFLILRNVVLPPIIFLVLRHYQVKELWALTWTALVPTGWLALIWVARRQVDFLSLLVLLQILVSIGLAIAFHTPRLILLKGPVQVGLIGLLGCGLLASRHPLGLTLVRFLKDYLDPARLTELEHRRQHPCSEAAFRRILSVWVFCLLADALLRTLLIFRLSIGQYLWVAPLLQAAFYTVLTAWSFAALRQQTRE